MCAITRIADAETPSCGVQKVLSQELSGVIQDRTLSNGHLPDQDRVMP